MPQPKPPAPPPPPPTPRRLSSRRVSTRWVARACLLRLARPGPPRLLLPRPLRCLRDNRRSTAHRVLVARLQIRASTRTVPGARPLRPSGSAWPWVRSGSFCEVIIKVFRQEKTEMPQFLRIPFHFCIYLFQEEDMPFAPRPPPRARGRFWARDREGKPRTLRRRQFKCVYLGSPLSEGGWAVG